MKNMKGLSVAQIIKEYKNLEEAVKLCTMVNEWVRK